MIKIVLDPNQHLVTDQPPVKPKAGETYLIQCKTYEDWSRAAYFIDERPGRILVTYAGDENVYIPNPHGNTKRDKK